MGTTVSLFQKTMKAKHCYLCKENSVQAAFKKLGWTILRCQSCRLYSLDFNDSYSKFIREYYNKDFFTGSETRAGYYSYEGDRSAEEKNMRAYLEGIKKFKRSGKLLDVGCATGIFMVEAQKDGFEVYGIDVSDYAVKIAKKRFGKCVKRQSVEKAAYTKKKFDVITMFDVIEHLSDPKKVLDRLAMTLADDGLLVINTGDTESFLAKIQGRDWHFFIPPQHFFYFSEKTLRTLLAKSGFAVIQIDRKGKWLTLRYLFHLARQIQNDIFGKIGFALFGKNRLGRIPLYLNLFDNITVYATKQTQQKQKNA